MMPGSTERKPVFKYVDFDLPFILFIEDSLDDPSLRKWAEAYMRGDRPLPHSPYAPADQKPETFVVGGALPVFVPREELANYYTVALPGLTVAIRTLRRVNPHGGTVVMGEVPGDRTGRASFSTVRVQFDLSPIDPKHYHRMDVFCKTAIDAINYFISHYRVIADRPYVNAVTMSTIQRFIVVTRYDDKSQTAQEYGVGGGSMYGMSGSIPKQQDDELRRVVSSGSLASIEETLDANIRDHLDVEQWRLAVIETAVAFEAWLSSFVRVRLAKLGLSPNVIDKKFQDKKGAPRSVTWIAKNLILEAVQYDFASSGEYAAWATNVRDLRNDIVHGSRFDVAGSEALCAYTSMKSAIAAIEANSP